MSNLNSSNTRSIRMSNLLPGAALISIGILSLAGQFLDIEWIGQFFLLALGAIFLVWGLLSRTFGLIIPGSILAGLGTGIFLVSGPLSSVPELTTPAILLLSFAGGWLLMSLLSLLTSDGFQSWPLIPAAIMSLIGGAFLMGEEALKALSYVGQAWPVVLIVIGLYIILVRKGAHSA